MSTVVGAIQAHIQRALAKLHTSMPGYVTAYDASTQTAEVQPHLRLAETLPGVLRKMVSLDPIPNVPVLWPGGGGFGMHCPLAAGDTVLLVFCERSIDRWRSSTSSQPVDPGDQRKHSLTGAVAVPLLRRNNDAMDTLADASKATFGEDGDLLIKVGGGLIELGSASDFVALAAKVDEGLQKIDTIFGAWTPVAQDGGAALKTAYSANAPVLPAGGTAASETKAA